MGRWFLICGVVLLVASIFQVANARSVVLTDETFDESIASGTWFIKFYAPWCGHCKKLEPIWEVLGKSYEDDQDIHIGEVDCTEQPVACQRFKVRGFPTLFLVKGDEMRHYGGYRNLEDMDAFVKGGYENAAKETVPATLDAATVARIQRKFEADKAQASGKAKPAVEDDPNAPSHVVELEPAGLWELSDKATPLMVVFYAPWCGHCKNLMPTWKKLSVALKDKGVVVGQIDATKHRDFARSFGVKGFPTLFLIEGRSYYEYEGDRSLEDLMIFSTTGYKSPDVKHKTIQEPGYSMQIEDWVVDLAMMMSSVIALDNPYLVALERWMEANFALAFLMANLMSLVIGVMTGFFAGVLAFLILPRRQAPAPKLGAEAGFLKSSTGKKVETKKNQ